MSTENEDAIGTMSSIGDIAEAIGKIKNIALKFIKKINTGLNYIDQLFSLSSTWNKCGPGVAIEHFLLLAYMAIVQLTVVICSYGFFATSFGGFLILASAMKIRYIIFNLLASTLMGLFTGLLVDNLREEKCNEKK